MKKIILAFLFLILVSNAYANEDKIAEGQTLVQSRVSCSSLSEAQLESIGEYYMELMHSGQLHEIMDERMGGEGSETLRQAHVNIAQMMYCGNKNAMPMSMMNIMMNRGGSQNMMSYSPGFGMMSSWQYGGWNMLFWIIIILLLVYFFIKYFSEGNFGSNSLEILKKRYAKGEITKKQFDQMKKDLK